MLIRACAIGHGRLACRVAALLSERDIMRQPEGVKSADLRVRIEALQATGTKTEHSRIATWIGVRPDASSS